MGDTIERIRQMERDFDAVQNAMLRDPASIKEAPAVREMIQRLIRYYESGQWLADYDRDAAGGLPAGLKRGVLSQDALYDLLSETGM